ncbi:MAG: hypothetical protein MZV70_15120 [Desulfobacterales bacterium]|nr:hypothetical protein [Desulfobacterales bacterium]
MITSPSKVGQFARRPPADWGRPQTVHAGVDEPGHRLPVDGDGIIRCLSRGASIRDQEAGSRTGRDHGRHPSPGWRRSPTNAPTAAAFLRASRHRWSTGESARHRAPRMLSPAEPPIAAISSRGRIAGLAPLAPDTRISQRWRASLSPSASLYSLLSVGTPGPP